MGPSVRWGDGSSLKRFHASALPDTIEPDPVFA